MRHVEVTSSYFKNAPYIYITNAKELGEYFEALDNGVYETIEKAIKSGVTPERLNHIIDRDDIGDQVLAVSYARCSTEGGNPLVGMAPAMQNKMQMLGDHLMKYGSVLINKAGGFCNADKDWVITDVPAPAEKPKFKFAKNPSFINLENDAHLEQHTRKWFQRNNYEISFIKKLRRFSLEALTKIFTDFKEAGGKGIYVYTTGIDAEQVHDYCDAVIKAELTDAIFEFNSGKPSDHVMQALDNLVEADVNVKIKLV